MKTHKVVQCKDVKARFVFYPMKHYPYENSSSLGHVQLTWRGVKGIAVFDHPPGVAEVEIAEVDAGDLEVTTAAPIGDWGCHRGAV